MFYDMKEDESDLGLARTDLEAVVLAYGGRREGDLSSSKMSACSVEKYKLFKCFQVYWKWDIDRRPS